MDEGFQADVFISHSKRERHFARHLENRLKADGRTVSRRTQELEKVRVLIVLASAHTSDRDWVSIERQMNLFRTPDTGERHIVPVRLDDSPLPRAFANLVCIEWQHDSDRSYQELQVACQPRVAPPKPGATLDSKNVRKAMLRQHRDAVSCVAITSEGRWAITGSHDRAVRVWNLQTGDCTTAFEGHRDWVNAVALTSDSRLAVSASRDRTIRIWDLHARKCVNTLQAYTFVMSVAVSAGGQRILTGSLDRVVQLWDSDSGKCTASLRGHSSAIRGVAITQDGSRAVSASDDGTLRLWNLADARCESILRGHRGPVTSVAITSDGQQAISGSTDMTVRVWNLNTGTCMATLEGHTDTLTSVALVRDGQWAITGSQDQTLRIWDLHRGQPVATLEGHTDSVTSVAGTPDGRRVVSGSVDRSACAWTLPLGFQEAALSGGSTRYTNAKVVLAGETGVGKSGLALRLCNDRWELTPSTHGMLVSSLTLMDPHEPTGIEREVWLWDLAGQPDYRLIHQLYMDETALGLLVFNPQDDNAFEALGHWIKALDSGRGYNPVKLLVAARCDRGGITISMKRFKEFAKRNRIAGPFLTAAKTGEGCEELKNAIASNIPWDQLPWTSTTQLFRTLKLGIMELADQTSLVRVYELRQRLSQMLPGVQIGDSALRPVVRLMEGQGTVKAIDFGDFLLLRPQLINHYASVVVRMAREHSDEMGTVPEQQVLDGRLDYKDIDIERLPEEDELILLRAMVQTFLGRSLCLREQTRLGTMLVFPSYFRRDRPELPEYPNIFETYRFEGALDTIWATLVVQISYSQGFQKDQLWKDAADFRTTGGRRCGLAMKRLAEGAAEVVVYFDPGVPDDTKVTFTRYVHEHLLERANPLESLVRIRTYVCPHCGHPQDRRAVRIRLENGLTDIICPVCEERLALIDLIEEKFASDTVLQKVQLMSKRAQINLDNESRELMLVGQCHAVCGSTGDFRLQPQADCGIDGEIELRDREGRPSSKSIFIQLKSWDWYRYEQDADGSEVFTIKDLSHIERWRGQTTPVMLVHRTTDKVYRWMDITGYVRKQGEGVRRIIFDGEEFSSASLQSLRDKLLRLH